MFKKLAKIKYLPNNFEIIEQGDYVVCAISKLLGKYFIFANFLNIFSL